MNLILQIVPGAQEVRELVGSIKSKQTVFSLCFIVNWNEIYINIVKKLLFTHVFMENCFITT